MDYQVWVKDEYEDKYTKVDCGDIEAAKRELVNAARKGQEPILTVEVPFELLLKVGEPGTEPKKKPAAGTKKNQETPEEVTPGETDKDQAE